MGSAASAASTDSANIGKESPTPPSEDENTGDQASTSTGLHQLMRPVSELHGQPGNDGNAPSTSRSSHSVARSENRSLAPSRRSKASERGRSHDQASVARSQFSVDQTSLLIDPLLEDMSDERMPSPAPSISDEQKAIVCECLSLIEAGLVNSGVHLNAERVLPYVETVMRRDESIVDGEALLKSSGIYIVQDGVLDMCVADRGMVTQRLEAGEFFGELSTLFRVPWHRKVNVVSSEVTLLHLPTDVVRECASVDEGAQGFSKEVMLNWCVKKSYLESSNVFGHKVLSRKVVQSCLQESVLSDLSQGAMEFIAELATPMLFDPGDILYSAGEDANYIFLILKGGVHTMRGENIVDSKTVKYSDEGFCLGHLEFFSGVKLNYGAKAASPVTVATVSKEILVEMLNMFPDEITALKVLLSKYKINK